MLQHCTLIWSQKQALAPKSVIFSLHECALLNNTGALQCNVHTVLCTSGFWQFCLNVSLRLRNMRLLLRILVAAARYRRTTLMPSWETERNLVFPIDRVMQCSLACTMSTSNGNVLEVSDSSEEESEEDEYETEEDNKEDENEAEVEDEPGEACTRLLKAKGASISRVRSLILYFFIPHNIPNFQNSIPCAPSKYFEDCRRRVLIYCYSLLVHDSNFSSKSF